MLVSMKDMLQHALRDGYAVGQFNINNLEWVGAVLSTAQQCRSPVILGVSGGTVKHMLGLKCIHDIVVKEVAIKWSAAPDMTPQTVLYRRPVAQFSNFQPKIVSSWLILALFQANFLISGRSRLCPYQLVNSNQVRQGE